MASNYDDSDSNLAEHAQIDAIEEDMRELREMMQLLLDTAENNNGNLGSYIGPVHKKVNRIYLMLEKEFGTEEDEEESDGTVSVPGFGGDEIVHSNQSMVSKLFGYILDH